MDYVILEGNNRSMLEGVVDAALEEGWKLVGGVVDTALEEGWELVGGVAVVWDGKEKTYYQAIKRKI